MRLNGEVSDWEEEEEEESRESEINMQAFPQQQKLVVGYALTLKKKKSFLQPKFERLARNKGILLVAIDLNRPLSDQGPFDIILHKLLGKEWCEIIEISCSLIMNHDQIVNRSCKIWNIAKQLEERYLDTKAFNSEDLMKYVFQFPQGHMAKNNFAASYYGCFPSLMGETYNQVIGKDYRKKHPEVTVLDPPHAIRHLHNRQSMLQDVADLNLSDCHGKVGVPRQMVIANDPPSIPDEVTKAGLRMPLVAKPLVVDGSTKSHELFLAYDQFSLSELEPPLVLQEFVNHGGVLFKIYIVGDAIKVVRRFSLPNISKCELAKVAGVYRFPRVSSAEAAADDADLDPDIAELPPRPMLEKLARELRCRLGLRLFNIDMIREYGTRDVFYVIDINYFPGYGKMPDYEHIFTDFLLSFVQSKCKKKSTTQLVELNIHCTCCFCRCRSP